MASEHHHLQLEKPPYPKVERPQIGRIKQRAERSNHKINLCAIRTSIGRDLGGPHLSIIQGGPELEVLFLVMSPSAIGDLISIHKVEIEISGGW